MSLNALSNQTLHHATQPILDTMLDALVEHGWFVWPNALPDALCLALLDEVAQLEAQGELQRAGIGRGGEHHINQTIRRDHIKWLDQTSPAQQDYLAYMHELQTTLNRALYLGLNQYESHFALYNSGDFYKKHLDSFRGRANRMVTTVLYLNPDWQAHWGGELVIYNEDSTQTLATVTPQMGTLVLFMSEQIPHEVLPTQQPRTSVAGWFRCQSTGL